VVNVTWVTPKTNWLVSDGVANTDLNRVEENTRVLSQQGGAYGLTTGGTTAYLVTNSPPITSLAAGAKITIKMNASNTGASTLNVDGLGAIAIKHSDGTALSANDLLVDSVYTLVYNGTFWFVQGGGGAVAAATTSVLGTVEVADSPAAGSPIVPILMGAVKEFLLTGTGITTTHTLNTVDAGNYLILGSFRVKTASTNVTIEIDWTDAAGAQVNTIVSLSLQTVGTHGIPPLFINATAGSAITIKVTAGTANQVYMSSSILGVG
jgi:hypothetical protein